MKTQGAIATLLLLVCLMAGKSALGQPATYSNDVHLVGGNGVVNSTTHPYVGLLSGVGLHVALMQWNNSIPVDALITDVNPYIDRWQFPPTSRITNANIDLSSATGIQMWNAANGGPVLTASTGFPFSYFETLNEGSTHPWIEAIQAGLPQTRFTLGFVATNSSSPAGTLNSTGSSLSIGFFRPRWTYLSTATANNNQRKIVRGASGTLYLVYAASSSPYLVHFTKSADNGVTWSRPIQLSFGGDNISPSITERSGYLYAVWQKRNGANWDIVTRFSVNGGTSWAPPLIIASGVPNSTPVILAGTLDKPFELMIVYKASTGLYSIRTTTPTPDGIGAWSSPIQVQGSTGASSNPSLVYRTNSYAWYKLVWMDNGRIYHSEYYPPPSEVWTNRHWVNSGTYGLVYNEASPVAALTSANDIYIAWQGYYGGKNVIVFNANLGSTYGVISDTYGAALSDPSITGLNDGTAIAIYKDNTNHIRQATLTTSSGWYGNGIIANNSTYPSATLSNPPDGAAWGAWTPTSGFPRTVTVTNLRSSGAESGPMTKVELNGHSPQEFKLHYAYPNPFNPSTIIKYSIPENTKVTLKVFDVLSQEVASLVNEEKGPGNYEVTFEANGLPSGVYFYRLEAGKFTETRKMILMK